METPKDSAWTAQIGSAILAYIAGNYDEAEELIVSDIEGMSELIAHGESLLGDLHQILANVYRDQDRYQQADSCYRIAIRYKELQADNEDRSLLYALRDYATSLSMQGKFDDAFSTELHTLMLAEKTEAKYPYDVHASLSRLCALAIVLRRYDTAEDYFRRLISFGRQSFFSPNIQLNQPNLTLGRICPNYETCESASALANSLISFLRVIKCLNACEKLEKFEARIGRLRAEEMMAATLARKKDSHAA